MSLRTLGILSTDPNANAHTEGVPAFLVSVNPDLASDAGHYLYLDCELACEAAARGWRFESWGNAALPMRLLGAHAWMRPVFADSAALVVHHGAEQRERYFRVLLEQCHAALDAHPAGDVILFSYAGHPCQLAACWRVLQRITDPRLRIVFNLYAAHWEFDEEKLRYRSMADTLRRTLVPGAVLADRQRFVLTSDSKTIAALAERWWWAAIPVLPFFSIARVGSQMPADPGTKPVTVAYPSSVHRHRGFSAFPAMVQHCRATLGGKVRFVFRTCMEETALSADEWSICNQLRQLECEIRHGSFTQAEMGRFFAEADIILSPYPVSHFKDRTSANVADALAFGKPVIAACDTWAGRLIERLGCGKTFVDGDSAGMARALMDVAQNLAHYTQQAQLQGAAWRQENNLAALVTTIHRLATSPPSALSRTAAEDWTGMVLELLDSPANETAHAPRPSSASDIKSGVTSQRWNRMKQRVEELQEQNLGMRRAIEHYRASPVRALRLWLHRKLRRLTLEE